ncbi:uncharacterized protein LOC131605797 [Vicia villosa]|uniref:uncharacterized protein LOC131605797 n=1 Tax=Vicia villosa TaxID=3911 RepID=UPI00273AC19C|nr:uncharacterized protein LOC131605797 [Vicia villosa]
MACNKGSSVAEAGSWDGSVWSWKWEKILQQGAAPVLGLLAEFFCCLQQYQLEQNVEDSYGWQHDTENVFTVKSCVKMLNDSKESYLPAALLKPINKLWEIKVPPSLLMFGWRFLLNRIATKEQLFKRGILTDHRDLCCVFCVTEIESLPHLFRSCTYLTNIWKKVYEWMGIEDGFTLDDFMDFLLNCEKVKCHSKRNIMAVIWIATVWSIWLTRNAIVFKNEEVEVFRPVYCGLEYLLYSL